MGNEISIGKAGGVTIIKFTGHVDSDSYTVLGNALDNLLKQGTTKIVVDLSEVTYMSSAGWGVLVGNLKKARDNRGNIVLAALSEEVKAVYELIEFNEIIKSYNTVEAAVKSFS